MPRTLGYVGQPLTYKEFQAAQCIRKGIGSGEATQMLRCSPETAKTRYRRIMAKTGARTVAQLVYWMNCELFLAGLMVLPKRVNG